MYYEYSDHQFRFFTVHRDVQLTVHDFMVYSVFPFNYTHQAVFQNVFELVSSLCFLLGHRPINCVVHYKYDGSTIDIVTKLDYRPSQPSSFKSLQSLHAT